MLEATMAGLVWPIPGWQIVPGCAGFEDEQYPVQHLPRVSWPATTPFRIAIAVPLQEGFHQLPLRLRNIHAFFLRPFAPEYNCFYDLIFTNWMLY